MNSSSADKFRIAITLGRRTIHRIDQLVAANLYANRSRVIEQAIKEKFERIDRSQLARVCARLDPAFERSLAEGDFSEDLSGWPER